MKRKTERTLWASLGLSLIVALGVALFPTGLEAQSGEQNANEYLWTLEDAYRLILKNYADEIPPEQLFEGAIKGLFESLDDPYSAYLSTQELQDLQDTTSGEFGGVGLYIASERYDEENPYGRKPYVKVVAPIEGAPAYRAGILAGDYIYEIDGKSAKNFSSDDVSDLLRGEAGTTVDVVFLRGKDILVEASLTRAIIEIPTVKWDYVREDVGFIRIIQFTPYTAERVEEALREFKKKNLKSLIIDVRGNPGGLLSSVLEVSDFFFSNGTIVSIRSRIDAENAVHTATPGKLVEDNIEVYLLVDGGSASASEILTGVLKDRGRATVVGEKTFGKGSVQQPFVLPSGVAKLTMAKYYTPNGANIDKTGIEPHIPIEARKIGEEDLEGYKLLIEENRIPLFIDSNNNPSQSQIQDLIVSLKEEGIQIESELIEIMIRNEVNNRMETPPVFDLKYDRALKRVMELIGE